jgi:hypothetical protein
MISGGRSGIPPGGIVVQGPRRTAMLGRAVQSWVVLTFASQSSA